MKSQTMRADYRRLIDKYKLLGKGNVRLTESSLTLVQPISATKTQYNFPVLENEQLGGIPVLPEEIRLNINDEFIVSSIGLYLYGDMFPNGAEPTPPTMKIWHTYAPIELSGAFRTVADLYSGFLSVAVNKVNYIDKWDTKKHEYDPQTQWESFVAGATGHKSTRAQVDFSEDGIYTAQPNFTLSGAKKNEISLTLPNAIVPATGPWTSQDGVIYDINVTKILICFRGLLAQNAAKFQ